MDKIQQYAVKSNTFLTNLGHALPKLLTDGKFVDVTLSCEGHKIKCHRLVLAASSPLFEDLFSDNLCEHPILIMPSEIKTWEMLAVIDFMYKGSVNLSCDGLKDFMKTASILQIRGLYDAPVVGFPDNEAEADAGLGSKVNGDGCSDADDGMADDSLICIPDSPEPPQPPASPFANNNDEYHKNSNPLAADSAAIDDSPVPKPAACDSPPATASTSSAAAADNAPSTSNALTAPVGKIRVTPNEYLFDHSSNSAISLIAPKTDAAAAAAAASASLAVPSALKYNKNSMAISVKSVDMSTNTHDDGAQRDDDDEDCENIVCSPNVSYICSNDEDTGEFAGWPNGEIDYDKMIDETYGSNADLDDDDDGEMYGNQKTLVPNTSTPGLPVLVPFALMNKQLSAMNKNGIVMSTGSELKITDARSTAAGHFKRSAAAAAAAAAGESDAVPTEVGSIIQKRIRLHALAKQRAAAAPRAKKALNGAEVLEGMELTPNEVILRNPRSNQPRTYGTTALYNALMAVKNGKSIYRASREHQVPRKTLRNWMKRWHIKSQFPMPSQLKDAAIKKRLPKMEKPDDEIQT